MPQIKVTAASAFKNLVACDVNLAVSTNSVMMDIALIVVEN